MLDVAESTLPESPGRLIGRDTEVLAIHQHLVSGDVRLLTISGVGGIGKTRLALEVARTAQSHFKDGARFVELAPFRESGLVLSAIQAVVAPNQPPSERQALDALKRKLQRRHLLLVLDNFEQVIEAAPLVSELLAACPRLSVLATSRSPLHLTWELEFMLGPLETPPLALDRRPDELLACPSVALLVERLAALGLIANAQPGDLMALAGICRRLDGIPLALELAAARAKLLPLPDVLARLEHPLELLTSGARDSPSRHRALRATFDWSYELLTEPDRRVFRALGAFVGGCTLEAAARVCGAAAADVRLLDSLGRLVDSGLVNRVDGASPTEPRLMLLEPLREYALEQLHDCGERDLACTRHAITYLELAELADRHLRSPREREWLPRLHRDYPNAMVALRWFIDRKDAERSLRLAAALCMFWYVDGYTREGFQRLQEALALPGPDSSDRSFLAARAHALGQAGATSFWRGDYETAIAYEREALALFTDSDDPGKRGFAAITLADTLMVAQELDQAEPWYVCARELYRQAGDTGGVARVLMNMGHLAWYAQKHDLASTLLAEAVPPLCAAADWRSAAFAARTIAIVECQRGDLIAAKEWARESVSIWREVGGRVLLPFVLEACAIVAVAAGDNPRGLRIAAAASALRDEMDTPSLPRTMRELDRWLAHARAALGPAPSQRAWAAGQALNDEAAIAEALAADGEGGQIEDLDTGRQSAPREAAVAGLTARETEVLRLVAAGNTNKEIANQLQISVATVERHLANVYAKLGARGRAEATAFAITRGLATTQDLI